MECKKYVGLYEEPTTYRYDYVPHPINLTKQTSKRRAIESVSKEVKCPSARLLTITAYDTHQQLSYKNRIPFNALWGPRDFVSIPIKASYRRKILGDEYLEDVITSRPRVHMSPSISLDDVQNKEMRKQIIEFTYTTTSNRANKDVWADFEPREICLPDETEKSEPREHVWDLPPGFQSAARKWDRLQDRSFGDIE